MTVCTYRIYNMFLIHYDRNENDLKCKDSLLYCFFYRINTTRGTWVMGISFSKWVCQALRMFSLSLKKNCKKNTYRQ